MPRCTGRGVDQEMVQEHLTARSRRTPDLESRWYRKRYVVPGTAPELSTQAKSPRVESELWQGHAAVSHDAPGTPSGARDGDVPVPILGISFSGFGWMVHSPKWRVGRCPGMFGGDGAYRGPV